MYSILTKKKGIKDIQKQLIIQTNKINKIEEELTSGRKEELNAALLAEMEKQLI
jgi:hypothetical protein